MNCHVYLIHAERSNRLKIGMADNPQKRLASLQVGSPEELKIMYAVPIVGVHKVSRMRAKQIESSMHKRFALFRLHGEWFRWHPAIVEAFELLDSFKQLAFESENEREDAS